MVKKREYIAVFDSGVGGFSVLRQLRRQMPAEHYVYYGDCANAPYGVRSTEEVRDLTFAAADKLFRRYPLKALVVACNTATAAAIDALRNAYPDRVIIGIEPALKPAAEQFPTGNIGVMATEVTLREAKFDQLLHRFPDCRVAKIPAPGLVELVEAGKGDSQQTRALLADILADHVGKLDALVLGCTHYPFAERAIREILGSQCMILDGGEGTARETKRRLAAEGHLAETGDGSLTLLSSADVQNLEKLAEVYL